MHRVPNHDGKCRAFHGHRYVAEISCSAPQLNEMGMVVDFGVLKSVVGQWIEDHWDHTALLHRDDDDPAALAIVASNASMGRPAYLMDSNPTAENIVSELARIAQQLLAEWKIEVEEIRLWETPNASARWLRT
jgi:6-pyruvoyltetrahydropterin/6-carboxytetrahydropterin synthase